MKHILWMDVFVYTNIGKKSSSFGQGFILARLRALSQFIACNRLGFHLLCNIGTMLPHTHTHTSQSIYLFRQCSHSITEQKTHMVMSLFLLLLFYVWSSSLPSLLDLLFQSHTLAFNYLYTLIYMLQLTHSHSPALLSFGQFTLIMFVVFYAAVSTNKINAYHKIPIRQNCVSNSTTQSKYFNNDFSHTHTHTCMYATYNTHNTVYSIRCVYMNDKDIK